MKEGQVSRAAKPFVFVDFAIGLTCKLAFVFQLIFQYFEVLLDIPAEFSQFLIAVELIPVGGLFGDKRSCLFEVYFILLDENRALIASIKPSREFPTTFALIGASL